MLGLGVDWFYWDGQVGLPDFDYPCKWVGESVASLTPHRYKGNVLMFDGHVQPYKSQGELIAFYWQ
jgi:prepilin-type processing-associated H-X9-DG protein